MANIRRGVAGGDVALVADDDYPVVLHELIAGSREICWCSMFIVDLAPVRDRALAVDAVLIALQASVWRGVDTRLLIGGSRTNFDIGQLGVAALDRARQLAIPARLLATRPVRSSHAKLVIVDDLLLNGSHNWSVGAFAGQVQDSLLIRSAAAAAEARKFFLDQWHRASGGRNHASG